MSTEKRAIHWKPGETIHDGEWESLLQPNSTAAAPKGPAPSRVVDPGSSSSFSAEAPPSAPQKPRTVNRLFRPNQLDLKKNGSFTHSQPLWGRFLTPPLLFFAGCPRVDEGA